MSRLLLTLLFIASTVASHADDRSKAILSQLAARFKAYTSYSVDFKVDMKDEFQGVKGEMVARGDKFVLRINDYELIYDGKLQYTYSKKLNEVTIEPLDAKTSGDYLTNPSQLFFIYDKQFNHIYKGTVTENGKSCEVVEVTPKKNTESFEMIRLYIEKGTGNPIKMIVRQSAGVEAQMDIQKITANPPTSDKMFVFDKKLHPAVEVIDFR